MKLCCIAAASISCIALSSPGLSQTASAVPESTVLFSIVRIFDGKSAQLTGPGNVLVRGNAIAKISKDPIATDRSANTRIIDGAGRTLMPVMAPR